MSGLLELTLAEAARRVRRREVSPVELVEAALARIRAHDDVLRSLGSASALRAAGRILADTPTAIALARRLLSMPGQADASHLSGPKTS